MMDPDDFRACLISMGYDLVSAFSPGQSMTLTAFFYLLYNNTKTQRCKISFILHELFHIFFLG